jgi:hypothetical protein
MTTIKLTPQTWEATPYGSHWSFVYNLVRVIKVIDSLRIKVIDGMSSI